jgi:hypothetical protein
MSYLYVLEFGNRYNGMNQGLGQLFQAFSEIASYGMHDQVTLKFLSNKNKLSN